MNNANAYSFLAEANSLNLHWYCHKNYPEPNRHGMYGTPTFAATNGNRTASNLASGESPTTTSFVPYRNPFVTHHSPTMGQVMNTSALFASYHNPVPVHVGSNKRRVSWSDYDMSNVQQENAAGLKNSNEAATTSGRKKRKESETTPDAVKSGQTVVSQTSAKHNDTDDNTIVSEENDSESENSNNESKTTLDAHYDKQWMEMFDRLVEYKKKNGTSKVPYNYQEDPQLRNWCHCQKHYCKREDRRRILESIGFEWQATTYRSWDEMYDRLVKFQKERGHTRVPLKYKPDPLLGSWVKRQRVRCKERARIDKLNAIGFQWRVMRRYNWEEMFLRLVDFKKKYNTAKVPRGFVDDPDLATWVRIQRFDCKQQQRRDLLDAVGFKWAVSKENEWESMYKRLVEYKKKHQTTYVPSNYEDKQLEKWVRSQRYHCKREDRIKKLEDIGFIWTLGTKRRSSK